MNTHYSVVIAAHAHLGFEGMASLIEKNPRYKVTCFEEHHQRLLETLFQKKADLLVMCYRFGGESVQYTIAQIKQSYPKTAVLVVSAQPRTFDAVSRLYDAGANAYLCSTTANQQTLFNALEQALAGQNYYTNSYKDTMIEASVIDKAPARNKGNGNGNGNGNRDGNEIEGIQALGQREKQVLSLIAQGNSAKEVARLLDISKNTVEVHRRNIMIKLNLRKSTELTRYAVENDLIEADKGDH